MKREEMLQRVKNPTQPWDIIIIGGGATGIGAAIEAATRGYQTLLLEQADFGQGTSSRSTKLIHGGVRYLKQGNISLVLEALKERGLLLQNAPHLVSKLPNIVPNYKWWEIPLYGIGLKVYDLLAGKYSFGASRLLSKKQVIEHIPTISSGGLLRGVLYYDAQFDDSRLIINMAETAAENNAALINYMKITGIQVANEQVQGVLARDEETGEEYEIQAKVVINATGVFADSIRFMENAQTKPMIQPSQGAHIVLDKSFLPGNTAIMVPKTDDGRVLFAIPWHNHVLVGTTDTPVEATPLEPKALPEEIDFMLKHAARYLNKTPTSKDVLSVFAGLRPLVSATDEKNTATISREHTLHISQRGLVTITGGKWTTYRKMAVDTIDAAVKQAQLASSVSRTKDLPIHGFCKDADQYGHLAVYGSDAPAIQTLLQENPAYRLPLHSALPYLAGEVVWAVRYEMARTVEDVLSRRTRALPLNARASIEMAPKVAELMAAELGLSKTWQKNQVESFQKLARNYLITEK